METHEFPRALALGLGRGILHLRDHDGHPYRELILDACLHNRAYDPQVEGSRAAYMLEVIRESREMAFFTGAVLRSLFDTGHDWDTPQRFELARRLAQSGNTEAREAMYAAFKAAELSASDVAVEFIELDGINGLLFVVGQIGRQLTANASRWEDDFLVEEASRLCGEEPVDAALQDAAKTNADVRAFLDGVKEVRALRTASQRPNAEGLTYDQIRSLIESGKAGGIVVRWAEMASDSDLQAAGHDLVQERDPKRLISYLHMFRKRPFPLEITALLNLVELPDGPIPRHALRALANLQDDSVRHLAFKLIETSSSERGYSIDLLVNNFRDGDHRIVETWCDAETDPDTVNAFSRSLPALFAAHPDADTEKRLLRSLYEREPCAHCRCSIVECLIQLNALTEDMRRECVYDSYADTRSLMKVGATS